LATSDSVLMEKMVEFKSELAKKIVKANQELSQIKYPFKTN
jgi:5-(carboxyamino)imidazole ribonucleotide mutase